MYEIEHGYWSGPCMNEVSGMDTVGIECVNAVSVSSDEEKIEPVRARTLVVKIICPEADGCCYFAVALAV